MPRFLQWVVILSLPLARAAFAETSTVDPLEFSEAKARDWAIRFFQPEPAAELMGPWSGMAQGSFEEFRSIGSNFARVFPASGGAAAAVVTYRREAVASGAPRILSRAVIVDRMGAVQRAFDVDPQLGFVLSEDGKTLVGHGDTMERALACGALHTSLTIYRNDGKAGQRITSPDFSPRHEVILLSDPGVAVLAVAGLIVAYDLTSGVEAWRRPLGSLNDYASLERDPRGGALAALIQTHRGQCLVSWLDGTGTEKATLNLAGRPAPGRALRFTPAGHLAVREIVAEDVRVRLLDAQTLNQRRVMAGW